MPELLAHLEGRLDLDEALARALARTRQYAKRQMTWLRHQLPELQPLRGLRRRSGAAARGGGLPAPPWLTDAALPHSFRCHPAARAKNRRTKGQPNPLTAAEASIEEPRPCRSPVRDRDAPTTDRPRRRR